MLAERHNLKMVEIKAIENNAKIIDVNINEKISSFIENNFKEDILYFEKKNKIKININIVKELHLSEYIIDFKSKSKKVLEKVEKFENLNKTLVSQNDKKIKIKKNKKTVYKKRKFIKKKLN